MRLVHQARSSKFRNAPGEMTTQAENLAATPATTELLLMPLLSVIIVIMDPPDNKSIYIFKVLDQNTLF